MIELALPQALRNGRNLLAFSHGVDSTALFYLLHEAKISFDIAIVDYNLRASSKVEIASARELASKFDKRIFELSVCIEGGNFESRARAVRYEFFERICTEFGYENLILAHQLNDKFEWFLMQLAKGAGLNELLGMREFEKRAKFNLFRPLLGVSKARLLEFLQSRGARYFVDESNADTKFRRNFFRAEFSEPFLDKFSSGVGRSFEILAKDAELLEPEISHIQDDLYAVKINANLIRGVDRVCKILGVMMSKSQRVECERELKNSGNLVIGGKVAVGVWGKFVLISPYRLVVMSKKFKEDCRLAKVPKLLRGYLFSINFDFKNLPDW